MVRVEWFAMSDATLVGIYHRPDLYRFFAESGVPVPPVPPRNFQAPRVRSARGASPRRLASCWTPAAALEVLDGLTHNVVAAVREQTGQEPKVGVPRPFGDADPRVDEERSALEVWVVGQGEKWMLPLKRCLLGIVRSHFRERHMPQPDTVLELHSTNPEIHIREAIPASYLRLQR